jgi:hypothetical protein
MKVSNIVGVALALCVAAPAVATDISRKLCKSDRAASAIPAEDERISYTCRGVAGFFIDVVYAGSSLRVRLRDAAATNEPQLGASYDIGDKIEWRGHPGPRGFQPEAAILRLTSYDDGPTRKLGSVLAVLRVAGKNVCAAALIDTAGTPQPNEAARRIADEVAAGFRCGIDQTRIVGPETSLAKETLARAG